jgi:hypothetical protein
MENLKTQTKQKSQKKSPLVIVETDSEELSEVIEEPPKQEKKMKKEKPVKEDKRKQPRTEAQLKHFENMRKKREDNLKQKLLDKKIEASKILLENDVKPKSKKTKPIEESDEEEVIIIEKKKKQKPKTKRIIIEESSSDESSEEEEQERKPKSKAPERKFKSQQNKKSIIKINGVNNDNDNVNSNVDYSKFFI